MNRVKQLLATGLMVGMLVLPLFAGEINTPGVDPILEPTPTPTPELAVTANSTQPTAIPDEIYEAITALVTAVLS